VCYGRDAAFCLVKKGRQLFCGELKARGGGEDEERNSTIERPQIPMSMGEEEGGIRDLVGRG